MDEKLWKATSEEAPSSERELTPVLWRWWFMPALLACAVGAVLLAGSRYPGEIDHLVEAASRLILWIGEHFLKLFTWEVGL